MHRIVKSVYKGSKLSFFHCLFVGVCKWNLVFPTRTRQQSLGTNIVVLWDWLWPQTPSKGVRDSHKPADCTFWYMEHPGTQRVFYRAFSAPQTHSMAAVRERLLLRFKNLNLLLWFLFWVILVILLNDGLRLLNGKFLKGVTPEYCDEVLPWSCFVLGGMWVIPLLRVLCWMWYGGDHRHKLYHSTLL